ncbi:ornithine carbamoyltransferase [Microlunatus flavus]|uniref:Ornithine carbamoyltransferase n=1 Tax=Microlunatus flavus TaxID=1036181 RepID=A0A1H9DXK9_9ACTN|nr:ornithine carbamoyltransferase [Microlunatus flavus]SEQ18027.1 ornithine carbamoyltransferase [Microlunatus flavus]
MTAQPSTTPVRHLLADDDLTQTEQAAVLDLAERLRTDPYAARSLAGPRSVAVIFDKPTLRTQASFSAGIAELGGFPMMVDGRLAAIGKRETIPDVARVLGRQTAAIVWRTFAQDDLATMAAYAGVPVVNALTDAYHPCQILADLQTLRQHGRPLPGLTFAYVGDGANNMAASYLLGGATAGMHVRIGAPEGFHPEPGLVARAQTLAAANGGSVTVTDAPAEAVAGADAVATDTWVSMGQEDDGLDRETAFAAYQVDDALLRHADGDALFLHCLPAYRGKEVSEEVLEGPRSVVWDEAENRRHAQKAVLTFLLERSGLVEPSGLLAPAAAGDRGAA